jgi:hypothetical protein
VSNGLALYIQSLSPEVAATPRKDSDDSGEMPAAKLTFYPASSNRASLGEDRAKPSHPETTTTARNYVLGFKTGQAKCG